jgi:regulator of nucleoside diphosphate kinase
MRRKRNITISSVDRDRLLKLTNSVRLDRRFAPELVISLEGEIARATIVPPKRLPDTVVSMSSTVWFRDLDDDEIECFTLVYPHEADVDNDRISVLAPIGMALLGYRVRDVVKWRVPQGTRRFEIVKVSQATATDQTNVEELVAS